MASSAQKSKNSYQKEKFLDLRTIKSFKKRQKSYKKATKKRQKSDNLSLFKTPPVAFVAPQKKRQKGDKRRHFVAFHFVAAHPRTLIEFSTVFWDSVY